MQRLEEQARKKREEDEEEERRRRAPLLKETAFDRRKVGCGLDCGCLLHMRLGVKVRGDSGACLQQQVVDAAAAVGVACGSMDTRSV